MKTYLLYLYEKSNHVRNVNHYVINKPKTRAVIIHYSIATNKSCSVYAIVWHHNITRRIIMMTPRSILRKGVILCRTPQFMSCK